MRLSKKSISVLVFIALMTSTISSQAAIVRFVQAMQPFVVGDTFKVTLYGEEFTNGTFGGGVSVSWNPSILALETVDTSPFKGDQALAQVNTNTAIDYQAGKLDNLSVASANVGAPNTNFDIAWLTFKALSTGTAMLQITQGKHIDGSDIVWTDYSHSPIDLQFWSSDQEIVTVPLPTAGWLFGTSLFLSCVGRLRRNRA